MAAVIFLTGMGTTITKFCCNNCLDSFLAEYHIKSIETESENSNCCKTVEHQKVDDCQKHNSNDDHKSDNCCKIERYSIDLDAFHFKPVVFTPFTWISSTPVTFTASLINSGSENNDSRINDPPPVIEPRNYLSLIRVLII